MKLCDELAVRLGARNQAAECLATTLAASVQAIGGGPQ